MIWWEFFKLQTDIQYVLKDQCYKDAFYFLFYFGIKASRAIFLGLYKQMTVGELKKLFEC
jgi:hypothetical protein